MVVPSHKGGAYERQVGKTLSLWLTRGEDNSQLIRSVSSGGWKHRNLRQVGDLAPNGERGLEFRLRFGVECKKREEFDWKHVFTSKKPALLDWWNKHAVECLERELVPMIVYRKNYQAELVGLPPYIVAECFSEERSLRVTWGEVECPIEVEFVTMPSLLAADPEFLLLSADAYLRDPELRIRRNY